MNENEGDAKQHLGQHGCSIISRPVIIKKNSACSDPGAYIHERVQQLCFKCLNSKLGTSLKWKYVPAIMKCFKKWVKVAVANMVFWLPLAFSVFSIARVGAGGGTECTQ